MSKFRKKNNTCNCFIAFKKKNIYLKRVFTYSKPPINEPNYKIKNYYRTINQCRICLNFSAEHNINVSEFYKKNYSIISHGNNIKKKFKKIINLGKKSDNYHRINRFLKYFKNRNNKKINLLDVGSGLSVFIYELKKRVEWNLFGIEPDINYVKFAKEMNLKVIHSNLKSKIFKGKKFDIITLNKVVEHVKDPVKFLKIINKLLKLNAEIYIEVPDGQSAAESKNGKFSEEFFVDHINIFSKKSLERLLILSNFKIKKLIRLKEKSGKFSLIAFAKKLDKKIS